MGAQSIAFCLSVFLLSVSSFLGAQTTDYVADKVFTQGVEGPAVDKKGNLYAVNFQEEGTIGIVRAANKIALFVRLPQGSTGNGIRIAPNGTLFVADYSAHNILQIDPKTRAVSVFAHSDKMNQPNDIALAKSGILYASDPNWKDSTGNLWMIDSQGQVSLLEAGMGTVNGVEVSADEKRLYVNESVQRNVWVYDRDEKTGAISNKRLLIQFADFGLDGMRCDAKGNLYIARYAAGEVVVISPTGEVIKKITLKGQKPTNVAFGGKDGKTVYVTLQDRGAIETFHADEPGREWLMLSAH